MKIESIIKRPGGTKVTMGKTLYHFKPDEKDQHVAEVEDQGHIAVFLGITDGYRSLEPLPVVDVSLDEALAVIKARFPDKDIEAFLYGATAPESLLATTPAGEQQSDEGSDAAEVATDKDPAGLADLSDEELRAEFEKLIGRKPHANMLRENMEAQITAALSEAGK